MPEYQIDEIKIRINGTNGTAMTAIDGVVNRLTSLKQAISDVNTVDLAETTKHLDSFAKSLSQMQSKDFKGFNSFVSKIRALQNLKPETISANMQNVAQAIKDLSAATRDITFSKEMSYGLNSITKALNAFSNISNVMNKFNPMAAKVFALGIREVIQEASKLSDIDVRKLEALATAMRYRGTVNRRAGGITDLKEAKDLGDVQTGGQGETSEEPVSNATNSRLSEFNARIRVAIKQMLTFKSAAKDASRASHGLGARLKGLVSDFARILKYRMLRSFIRMITKSFTEGIKNAYEYAKLTGNQFQQTMDSMATNALYVKNSLGAMTMPLLNSLAPAIDYIADKFVDLLNTINQFIAVITGASTWTRALRYSKEFGDGTKNAANGAKKAADDLKATILGIDEINLLNDNNEKAGSGSGGTSAADDYASMFETLEEPVSKFGESLKELFKPFKAAWDNVGSGVMSQWQYATSSIKSLLSDIGGTIKDVWTGGSGQRIIENLLTAWQGIETAVGNIATNLKTAWDSNGNGQTIVENIFRIFESISELASDIANSIADWAAEVNFEPLMTAIADFTGAIADFISEVTPLIKDLLDYLKPILTWIVEKGLPGVFDTGSTILGAGTKILQGDWEGAGEEFSDLIDKWNGTGKYSGSKSGAQTKENPYYDPTKKLPQENGVQYVMRQLFNSEHVPFSIDWVTNSIDEVMQAMGLQIGHSVGSKGTKMKVNANVKSTVDNITDTLMNLFGDDDTITKDLSFKTDSTTNQPNVKQWFSIKDVSVVKTLKSKLDSLFGVNKTTYEKTYQNGDATKSLKSKLVEFLTPQSAWQNTYKNEDATKSLKSRLVDFLKSQTTWDGTYKTGDVFKNLKSRLDSLFYNNKNPWGNTYVPDTVVKTLTSSLTNSWNSNKKVYEGVTSGTVTKTMDAQKTANFTQLTKEYVDLKDGTKKLTFDTEFKVKLKLDSGSSKATVTENVLTGKITYAQGGFPASGQIYFANEDGSSEYIGKFGNRAAVANNDQIVDGIAAGVEQAQSEQNRLLREQNELLRAIYQKENRAGSTSSSDVLRALSQTSRRTGHPVVSMG